MYMCGSKFSAFYNIFDFSSQEPDYDIYTQWDSAHICDWQSTKVFSVKCCIFAKFFTSESFRLYGTYCESWVEDVIEVDGEG